MRTLLLAIFVSALVLPISNTLAADDSPADKLKAAKLEALKTQLGTEEYKLRYRFVPGEVVRWKVVHLVTVETKIQGVSQTAKTSSASIKAWKILDADQSGKIRFAHVVESVNMWQGVSGRADVKYNSQTDEKPPEEYAHVAKSIGLPLATVTIDLSGKVLDRKSPTEGPNFNAGLGELTIPLPEGSVKVGSEWTVPDEVIVRLEDRQIKKIKTRQLYTLQAVETGIATINVETQVLTPVDDPKVKSQLVQRLTSGSIKFDIDAGRVLSKQMDLDETVLGFNGADSSMAYRARFTEEIQKEDPATAKKPGDATDDAGEPAAETGAKNTVKDREGKPVLRK